MKPLVQQLRVATRLTRAGDLQAATAAIQAVLGRASAIKNRPSDQGSEFRMPDINLRTCEIFDAKAARPALTLEHVSLNDGPTPETVPDATVRARRPDQGRFLRGTHADAHGARDYRLYVPPDSHGRQLPLIVMLHGCTQDPETFAIGTGMNDAALSQGFFVLYPAQAQSANANRCWNWFEPEHQRRDAGEPALIAGMTRAIIHEYAIDPQRVYVAGLSAGGAMAAILGDGYPDLYAAVGVHSGLATGAARDIGTAFAAMQGGSPALPGMSGKMRPRALRIAQTEIDRNRPTRRASAPPTIVFHGDRDHTVHASNGEHVVAACMKSAANHSTWSPDAAEQERRRSGHGREYTRRLHRNASGRVMSEHWIVHSAGHAWSGGRAGGSYTDPSGPDATAEMVRFFLANPAPAIH